MGLVITATIGRNISTGEKPPLSDKEWADFTEMVEVRLCSIIRNSLINDMLGDLSSWRLEVHTGIGYWDGVAEESRKISITVFEADGNDVSTVWSEVALQQDRFEAIREAYWQDNIAISVGLTELI